MARKQTLDAIIGLYKKLGGNLNDVLGTRSNISFLGSKTSEPILEMDINTEAIGVLGKSKILDEIKSSVGYATAGKLNDIQASKLLENMTKIDELLNPPQISNITDLRTGTTDLTQEGLGSLRETEKIKRFEAGQKTGNPAMKEVMQEDIRTLQDDLPPPGSRGGPEDIAAPFTGAGLEAIKNVKNSNLIVDDIVNKIYLNAGVAENAQPVVRANAREFLNRIKDLEDPEFPGGTTLSSVMEADDFKFATEGGGGGMGDPFLLVQKYFGPKVASSIAKLDGADDIQKFAENLVKIKDARGNSVTSRYFDPDLINPNDFEFADGGRVPMFAGGAARIGYQALRKYGIEAKDISRLFASLGSDKSLVGKEKTEYFRNLHKVLRNPDDYPDGIREIQIQLGIDIPGLKSGGLAGILEV
jgi:hypothetical protein